MNPNQLYTSLYSWVNDRKDIYNADLFTTGIFELKKIARVYKPKTITEKVIETLSKTKIIKFDNIHKHDDLNKNEIKEVLIFFLFIF